MLRLGIGILYEVKGREGCGAQSGYVAGVRRNLRFHQSDMQSGRVMRGVAHGAILFRLPERACSELSPNACSSATRRIFL